MRAAEGSLQDATQQAETHRQEVQRHESDLQAAVSRLAELQAQIGADKTQHFDEMRRAAHLQNEAVASKAQVDNLRRERDRLRQRTNVAAESLASVDVELQELLQAETQLLDRLQPGPQTLLENKQNTSAFAPCANAPMNASRSFAKTAAAWQAGSRC